MMGLTDQDQVLLAESYQILEKQPYFRLAASQLVEMWCRHLDWDASEFWQYDPTSSSLRLIAFWRQPNIKSTPFENNDPELRFERGNGIPGLVWNHENPLWIHGTEENALLENSQVARAGFHGAFGVPIITGDVCDTDECNRNTIGVFVFYSQAIQKLPESAVEIMTSCGSQIIKAFERLRLEYCLKEQESKITITSKVSAIGEMSGEIAHEINNPLTIISVAVDQLKDALDGNPLDAEALRKTVSRIEKSVLRISKITKGLRVFLRDGNKDPFQMTHLGELIEDTLIFCRTKYSQRNVALHVSDSAKNAMVECRSIQLSQVLLNLLNNALDAVEHLPEKWVKIDARDVGDSIELYVTDSGRGISPEIRGNLFRRFFTTKEVGKGTGLGLSISKRLIEAHHGTLRVDFTCPNTRFIVRLPKQQLA